MAVRAPTSFAAINSSSFLPRKPVILSGPSGVVDNQELILNRQELVLSDLHIGSIFDSAAYPAWTTIWRHWVASPDRCGSATTSTGQFAVYVSAFNALWDIGIYNNYNTTLYSFTTAAGQGWAGASGMPGWTDITLATDGSENDLELRIRNVTGVGDPLVIYGVGIYA